MRQHDEPRADGTLASVQAQRHRDAPGRIALLAATALGLTYAPTGDNETHSRKLVTLTVPHPESGSLTRAQTGLLTPEVGSADARTDAAALLRRESRNVVAPCGAGASGGRGAVGVRTATTQVRPCPQGATEPSAVSTIPPVGRPSLGVRHPRPRRGPRSGSERSRMVTMEVSTWTRC